VVRWAASKCSLTGRYLSVFLLASTFAVGLALATGRDVDVVLLPVGLVAVIAISHLPPHSRVVRRFGLTDMPRRVLLGLPRWRGILLWPFPLGSRWSTDGSGRRKDRPGTIQTGTIQTGTVLDSCIVRWTRRGAPSVL
jgi:hypothetical protein